MQQSNMHMHYSAAVWNWTGSKADLLDQLFYIWFQLFCYARRWRSQNNLVLGLQITPRWLTTKPSSSPALAYLWTTKEHRSLLSANDRCKGVPGMGKKREKEGPLGSGEDERLLGISLFTIYYFYFSLDYTDQTHLAIKQKGTKGPKEDKLIPDLWTENAITIRGSQHIAHVLNDHFIDKTGNKSKNKE